VDTRLDRCHLDGWGVAVGHSNCTPVIAAYALPFR